MLNKLYLIFLINNIYIPLLFKLYLFLTIALIYLIFFIPYIYKVKETLLLFDVKYHIDQNINKNYEN